MNEKTGKIDVSEVILNETKSYWNITETILCCCFEVINELGSGFLEAVYQNALTIALQQKGLKVQKEVSFDVLFRGIKIGYYLADIIVEDSVIVELKCCKALLPEHDAQVINYLKATKKTVGLLVNFGQRRLEYKRLYG